MSSDAAYFDKWYADMSASPRRDEIPSRVLGLPPELESTSLLPWVGIADVAEALQLRAGDTFVDLACGRGGYGLEIAHRTGAALIGIDFSAVAIERAAQRARERGYDAGSVAQFRVGDLVATGLPDSEADAALSIDAMQFAEPYEAAVAECFRILTPGGRVVLTGWQACDPEDDEVPSRLRRDVAAALEAAGFEDVHVRHMPAWRDAERRYWEESVEVEPDGDPALESLRDEGLRVLPVMDRTRRILATARKPEAS
jgi:ubiquinone/menaquinone biosynthesis C-methylase UbiE